MGLEEFIKQQDAQRQRQALEESRQKELKDLEVKRLIELAITQQTSSLVELVELFIRQGIPPVTLWYYDKATDQLDPQVRDWDIESLTAIDEVWPCSYIWINPEEQRGQRLSQCVNAEGKVYAVSDTKITPETPRSYSFRGVTTHHRGKKFHLFPFHGSHHVHDKVNKRGVGADLHLLCTTSKSAQVWNSHNLDSELEQWKVEQAKEKIARSESPSWLHPRQANAHTDTELLAMVYRRLTDPEHKQYLSELFSG